MDKIIINGRSLAGKDTFADHLVENYGFTKITFADGIYKIARNVFGMTVKDRALLQGIGEKMREIDPGVWVKAAFLEAKNHEKVVISDLRRANEYEVSQDHGFVPFRIHSALATRIQRCIERDGIYPFIDEWENESETGADDFPYYDVPNDGTKEELYDRIDLIMKGAN